MRRTPLRRATGLTTRTPLQRRAALRTTGSGLRTTTGLATHKPIRQVSNKQAAANRERGRMADALFPGARHGGQDQPLCEVYLLSQTLPDTVPAEVLKNCRRWGEDLHEPLTRARGGSITNPANATVPCRPCHDAIGLEPAWAYDLDLLKNSWDGAA